MTVSRKMNAIGGPSALVRLASGGLSTSINPKYFTVSESEASDKWKLKDESQFFKRWRKAAAVHPQSHSDNPHKSELLNLLAINALDLSLPASDLLLKSRQCSSWFQLAGHPGSLAPAGPNTVWKRNALSDSERETYEALSCCPFMSSAIPKYYGDIEYGSERFIELQDLLNGFKDPYVMDVKMGTRTFLESEVCNSKARNDLYEKMVQVDPNEPTLEEKAAKAVTKLRYMQFRERQSSTVEAGFRIEAVKMPGEAPIKDLKRVKSDCDVKETVAKFLSGRESARHQLIARLEEIKTLFEKSEYFKSHEIVGSSIFMIYDGEKAGAWLIDFAKTQKVPSHIKLTHRAPWSPGNHEEGFLFGLDQLIETLRDAR